VSLIRAESRSEREVRVRAPGKVNLSLRVGRREPDGYHPLSTVFQAVSVYEDVVASTATGLTLTVSGTQADLVPTDDSNLAARAARALADYVGLDADVHLHIHKEVPPAIPPATGTSLWMCRCTSASRPT